MGPPCEVAVWTTIRLFYHVSVLVAHHVSLRGAGAGELPADVDMSVSVSLSLCLCLCSLLITSLGTEQGLASFPPRERTLFNIAEGTLVPVF